MTKNSKYYDLEDRNQAFAIAARVFVKKIPQTLANIEDSRQLIRASGSVGANYIEANEALGKKDFFLRIKICRKESKEARYWLRLIDTHNDIDLEQQRNYLIGEATELMNIFGAILRKG
jgi:four helix bundle protein